MKRYNLDEKTGILSIFSSKNASKILKVDEKVEFKHYNFYDFIRAEVKEVVDDKVCIQCNFNMIDKNIFPNDAVVINSYYQSELYVMSGEVATVLTFEPLEIGINVKAIEKLKNLRKFERFYTSLPAYIAIPGFNEKVFAVVKNISLGGIKINCQANLTLEDNYQIDINFNQREHSTFVGKLIRKTLLGTFYEYGFEIITMSDGNSKAFHNYVYYLENLK